MFQIRKDPDSTEPYVIDWSDWLEGADTIDDATIEVKGSDDDPGDITVDDFAFTDTETTFTLSGGTARHTYRGTIHVTTANAVEDDRSFLVVMEDE